jgi:glycosyltransferase involved in cell wall biosynthesis
MRGSPRLFMTVIDFVIPVYNEGNAVQFFHESLAAAVRGLDHTFRFIYVNDGSTDSTSNVLCSLREADPRVICIELSRNFGHQAAISAGLDTFNADAVIMMDGDGEHPPAIVPEMIRLFESHYDVVQTQRLDHGRRGFLFKSITGHSFYWLLNKLGDTTIIDGAADFRLLSRSAAEGLRQLPEYHRFYRGMVQWIGFRSVILPYMPASRIAGKSKYSLRKMLRLASDGMFSFSLVPLRLGLVLGAVFLLLAAAEVIYVLHFWFRGESSRLVPGWSSLMVVLTLSSGVSMLLMGILGIYMGMIFQEVKNRPVYLIKPHEPQSDQRNRENAYSHFRAIQDQQTNASHLADS